MVFVWNMVFVWLTVNLCIILPIFWLHFEITYDTDNVYYLTPKYFYKTTYMNVFGCYLVTVILALLFPIYYLAMLVYWICHV